MQYRVYNSKIAFEKFERKVKTLRSSNTYRDLPAHPVKDYTDQGKTDLPNPL
jgi:hypothetical protein